ncbi:MAG TPA: NUDIX domain-containing protein [Novosphingobium sp.]|nr:NUDIX domain-containing protein [Novosphingobium sp.]
MSAANFGQRLIRRAARVVLLDEADRFLLFRYAPDGMAPFWFPPGGACEDGEDFATAARRELFEETGIRAEPLPLGRVTEYDYTTGEGVRARAIEHWFHWRTAVSRIDTGGHTEVERRFMTEHRWLTVAELHGWPETVYPADLAALIGTLARKAA